MAVEQPDATEPLTATASPEAVESLTARVTSMRQLVPSLSVTSPPRFHWMPSAKRPRRRSAPWPARLVSAGRNAPTGEATSSTEPPRSLNHGAAGWSGIASARRNAPAGSGSSERSSRTERRLCRSNQRHSRSAAASSSSGGADPRAPTGRAGEAVSPIGVRLSVNIASRSGSTVNFRAG